MLTELLGWLGSGLVVVSIVQRDVRRLRQINLAACVVLLVFNAIIGIASMVVMNVLLASVNVAHLASKGRPGPRRPDRDDRQLVAA